MCRSSNSTRLFKPRLLLLTASILFFVYILLSTNVALRKTEKTAKMSSDVTSHRGETSEKQRPSHPEAIQDSEPNSKQNVAVDSVVEEEVTITETVLDSVPAREDVADEYDGQSEPIVKEQRHSSAESEASPTLQQKMQRIRAYKRELETSPAFHEAEECFRVQTDGPQLTEKRFGSGTPDSEPLAQSAERQDNSEPPQLAPTPLIATLRKELRIGARLNEADGYNECAAFVPSNLTQSLFVLATVSLLEFIYCFASSIGLLIFFVFSGGKTVQSAFTALFASASPFFRSMKDLPRPMPFFGTLLGLYR